MTTEEKPVITPQETNPATSDTEPEQDETVGTGGGTELVVRSPNTPPTLSPTVKPQKWAKGGPSPNPFGRRKITPAEREAAALARAKSLVADNTEKCIDLIMKIATDGESETNRLNAQKFIVEQGLGKAPQRTEISGPDNGPVPMVLVFPQKNPE